MNSRAELTALAPEAIRLAGKLLHAANAGLTWDERLHARAMARLMDDAAGKDFTLALTDQVFRSRQPERAAQQFRHVLERWGVPEFLTLPEKLALRMGAWASRFVPGIVIPAVTQQLRAQSSRVILPGEDERLLPCLAKRRAAGFRMNLNQLGEAILGEEEAARRMQVVQGRLRTPGIDYVSVKISSIFSRINVLAWDATLDGIKARLRELYRAAIEHGTADGGAKFVNLDMEEYRDLELTLAAFQQVLDEPEFLRLSAGIVLQAYLPDSHDAQRRLTEWALRRVEAGGAPVKLRIVKGANLAMERVEAELHGWEQAAYGSKADTDASFKRIMEYAFRPEHTRAVRIGLASHNLFDVALAILLADARGVREAVEFEMLEGMANHQARAVRDAVDGLLLYAPVVSRADFHSAMSYLVRRLDENTAEENFLRHLFGLKQGSPAWEQQAAAFTAACERAATLPVEPRRTQDRRAVQAGAETGGFTNEPDTDWVLPHHREWIAAIRESWLHAAPARVPLVIAGAEVARDFPSVGSDPSRPGIEAYRHELATAADMERALSAAANAAAAWSARGVGERADILRRAADVMLRERGETIACMILDGGKSIPEADSEISEAIDFARYYAASAEEWHRVAGVTPRSIGPVVVAPPWNFPYAIPAGGVMAALAMGNPVIFKPAPETVLTAWRLAGHLWEAGVPRDVLQFVPCPDDEIGRTLITDDRVSAVILTGAWSTAQLFLDWKPALRLCAETSGKNSIVVTAAADRDQAIHDIVQSAFGHAGQKCSAASLAILEAELYDDARFLAQLRDAAASLVTGSAWNPASQVTPLIREPGEELARALTQLDPGETWLLEPRMVDGNPRCWTPGIRLGVKAGSWFRQTECFGPVLGVMRAADFEEAVRLQNAGEFGLTAGLHSLDEREIAAWRERVAAGNGYINRAITGAIVQRQPFGGWKKSSVGTGAKAGGPNYVAQFADWENASTDEDQAVQSYTAAWHEHFAVEHDPAALRCESNVFRYRPLREVFLRLAADTDPAALRLALTAATLCGTPACVSLAAPAPELERIANAADAACFVEDTAEAAASVTRRRPELLRTFSTTEEPLFRAAHALGARRVQAAPAVSGRLELTRWLKEQAISRTMHRYGNVLRRERV